MHFSSFRGWKLQIFCFLGCLRWNANLSPKQLSLMAGCRGQKCTRRKEKRDHIFFLRESTSFFAILWKNLFGDKVGFELLPCFCPFIENPCTNHMGVTPYDQYQLIHKTKLSNYCCHNTHQSMCL